MDSISDSKFPPMFGVNIGGNRKSKMGGYTSNTRRKMARNKAHSCPDGAECNRSDPKRGFYPYFRKMKHLVCMRYIRIKRSGYHKEVQKFEKARAGYDAALKQHEISAMARSVAGADRPGEEKDVPQVSEPTTPGEINNQGFGNALRIVMHLCE